MPLLKQNISNKKQVNKLVKFELEFNSEEDKKYKLKVIQDSAIYTIQAVENQIPGLYYLVFWKNYLETNNIRESDSAIMLLCKMISTFHKDHIKKSIATSLYIDSTLPIAKLSIKMLVNTIKQK